MSIFDSIQNTIETYLIFNEYKINPNDDCLTQIKMFILRYRRIIGIILLIILLYIGVNCDIYTYSQKGGASIKKFIKGKFDKKSINSLDTGQIGNVVGDNSKSAKLGRMTYQAGAYTGDKFKEFAGWLYQILFAIALSIAICMVVLPSITFFIVGIICFFLLKSKMSSFKSL